MHVRTPELVKVVAMVEQTFPKGPTREHILALLGRQDAAYQASLRTSDPAAVTRAFSTYRALAAEVDHEIAAYRETLTGAEPGP